MRLLTHDSSLIFVLAPHHICPKTNLFLSENENSSSPNHGIKTGWGMLAYVADKLRWKNGHFDSQFFGVGYDTKQRLWMTAAAINRGRRTATAKNEIWAARNGCWKSVSRCLRKRNSQTTFVPCTSPFSVWWTVFHLCSQISFGCSSWISSASLSVLRKPVTSTSSSKARLPQPYLIPCHHSACYVHLGCSVNMHGLFQVLSFLSGGPL